MNRSSKIIHPALLMGISLVLLIVLQGLWLRTEYNSAVNAFSRETNVIFRSTLHQLSDSIFFSQVNAFDEKQPDSINTAIHQRSFRPSQENIRQISILRVGEQNTVDTIKNTRDSITASKVSISFNNPGNTEDSITMERSFSSPQEMRWIFTGDMVGFNTDTIGNNFRRNLNPSYARLDFIILEKEFNFDAPRHNQRIRTDSLPFTTSFYPFARRLYAVEFHGVSMLIATKLLPQAGFALFTSGLIFFSFLLVYRSLRSQQKLLEQKDTFVSNITHELKTPVASVGVALEAIKSFDVLKDRERTMDYLQHAQKELSRLTILTDKILKTSVIDYSTEIKVNQHIIDLTTITQNVVDSFSLLIKEQDIKVHFETSGNTSIKGNEEHLTQVVFNLVDNAVKYAGQGRYLRISVGELPDDVVLEIEDHGPGIAPEHRKKIFEKFYRIPTGNVHNVKGYGLGLHYVASVIKQHNGRITVESSPGKCTKFIVKLKKAA